MFDFVEDIFDAATGFIANTTGSIWQASIRGVSEGIGEVTGRNLQRRALNEQSEMIKNAAADQQRLMQEERKRRYQQERQASIAAGRSSVGSTGRPGTKTGPFSSAGDKFDAYQTLLGGL